MERADVLLTYVRFPLGVGPIALGKLFTLFFPKRTDRRVAVLAADLAALVAMALVEARLLHAAPSIVL